MNSRDGLSFLFLAVICRLAPAALASCGVKAGYWPGGQNATFPPSSIEFSYFTHVYYAFVEPDQTTFGLVLPPYDAEVLPGFVAAAHGRSVKALLSIGGGGSNKTTFARMVSEQSSREAFIASCIGVARKFGLDGLDLDWEFPEDEDQMSRLGDLVTEWRAAVDREAAASGLPKLLLTAAVYYASGLSLDGPYRSYPAAAIAGSLDWINPMCYDFHGAWNTAQTGAPAALYDPRSNVSGSYGIESWIAAGVPPGMLVLGLPLYGHTWQLKDPADTAIGAPAVAVGPGDQGILVYSEIVRFNQEHGAVRVYDGTTVSAYSYSGTSWIGYDDDESTMNKVGFAKARGLAGYFIWALGFDDANSTVSATASRTWDT